MSEAIQKKSRSGKRHLKIASPVAGYAVTGANAGPLLNKTRFNADARRSRNDQGIGGSAPSDQWQDLDDAVGGVWLATPIQHVSLEQNGVTSTAVKWVADGLKLPRSRMFTILGVPSTTANRLGNKKQILKGAGSHATVALLSLIGQAENMLQESTAPEAHDFDVRAWLGRWIEEPQPSLGGNCPSALLGTPTGAALVKRALGAVLSGAYQ